MNFHWLNHYRFAFKLSLAIVMSLFLGFYLHLSTPRWSVITAGIVIAAPAFSAGGEPFAGAIRHRSWLRIIGTVVGCISGLIIVAMLVRAPVIMLTVCCLWVSVCTWASSFVREENSYAWGLAGITALVIIVTSSSSQNNLLQAPQIAIERSCEIILGIVCTIFADLLLSPRSIKKDIDNMTSQLIIEQFKLMQSGLTNTNKSIIDQRWYQHISQIQMLGTVSHHLQLESPKWRYVVQRIDFLNTLLLQMTNMICETNLSFMGESQSLSTDILKLFDEPVSTIHTAKQRIKMLHQILRKCSQQERLLPLTLWAGGMAKALLVVHGIQTNAEVSQIEAEQICRTPRGTYRSTKWNQAKISSLRVLFSTLIGCAFWLWTGWTSNSLFIVMVAVVTSLAAHSLTPRKVALDFVIGMLLAIPLGAIFFMLIMPAMQQSLLLLALGLGGLSFLIGLQVQKQRLGSLGTLAGIINILVLSNPMVFDTMLFIDNAAGQFFGSCLGLLMLLLIRDCPSERTVSHLLNGFVNRAVEAIGNKTSQYQKSYLSHQYQQLHQLMRIQPNSPDKCSIALYLILFQQLILSITLDDKVIISQKIGLQQRVNMLSMSDDTAERIEHFTMLIQEMTLFQHNLEQLKVSVDITKSISNLLKKMYIHKAAFVN